MDGEGEVGEVEEEEEEEAEDEERRREENRHEKEAKRRIPTEFTVAMPCAITMNIPSWGVGAVASPY